MKKLLLLSLFSVATVTFAQQEPAKRLKKQENSTSESAAVNTQAKPFTLKDAQTNQKRTTKPVLVEREATFKSEPADRKK